MQLAFGLFNYNWKKETLGAQFILGQLMTLLNHYTVAHSRNDSDSVLCIPKMMLWQTILKLYLQQHQVKHIN